MREDIDISDDADSRTIWSSFIWILVIFLVVCGVLSKCTSKKENIAQPVSVEKTTNSTPSKIDFIKRFFKKKET